MLLSGFANANRVYDHVSGFFFRGANSERFSLGFLATYTITENNITKHYVGVYSNERYGRAFDEWELSSAGVVNKVKSFYFTNEEGVVEQVGFIAMNRGLYMVRYLDDHPQPPKLIKQVSGNGYDVIDVLKTTFGFVIVVNEKGSFTPDSTVLYNLQFTKNDYKLFKSGEIRLMLTTSAECDLANSLVLATIDNSVLILTTGNLTNYNSSWHLEKQIFGRTTERFMVLPNTTTLSSIFVVKFSTESHHWYINNHILDSPDFTNFTDGENNPRYFDYAVSNALYNSIQATITNDFKIKSFNEIISSDYRIHKIDVSDFNFRLISASPLYYGMNYRGNDITARRTSVIYLIKEEGSEIYKAFIINLASGQEGKTSFSYQFPS